MQKRFITTLLLSALGYANTVVPSKGSDLKITIYNDDRAFVQESRQVEVAEGKQSLIYEGVPASVITPSVIPTFSGVATRLYSQNYSYDLISLQSMLTKSINQEVEFYTNEENPRLSRGRLLSANPVMVEESSSGKIYTLERPSQVIFSKIPETMITKPSLVWRIETAKAGRLGIDLKYLTTGISWKSDYVLDLKKESLDLTGWITVNNHSGVSYTNAAITCLAGKVHRAQERPIRRMYKAQPAMVAADAMAPVKEASFSGYHIYKIPFRETIANKEQKQIGFLEKKGVHYREYGVAQNTHFANYGEEKMTFANTISFANTKANQLGIALPSGVVRMYKRDNDAQTHFIGEHRIGNIPEDENVTLTIGTMFDVVGEKRITKFVNRNHYKDIETTYTLRNRGKTPVTLKIKEQIPAYGNHIKVKTSCKGQCSVVKKSAFVREFTVKLDTKGKYSFTSEFEVDY